MTPPKILLREQIHQSPEKFAEMSSFEITNGVTAEDGFVEMPLDYSDPSRGSISVFYRLLTPGKHKPRGLPLLAYLEGGPGREAPRPMHAGGGWLARALKEFRVVLVDQRGTGRSTRITHHSLLQLQTPQAQADYLACFRADNIVRDMEVIRKHLAGDKPWTVLGQSFGGFCLTTYLSLHPEGLSMGLFTGGIPPVLRSIEEVYRGTYRQVQQRNELFYRKFPGDKDVVKRILRILHEQQPVRLPSGGILTPRRFQQLGLFFGGSSGFHRVHYLLETAFDEGPDHLSFAFLREIDNVLDFDTNMLYALLHEPIYCQQGQACNWAAARVLAEPEFADAFSVTRPLEDLDAPLLFLGEMILPDMFDGSYCKLASFKDATQLLAEKSDWLQLYDVVALQRCEVPCAAAVYFDDMYVIRDFSLEVAAQIPSMKCWITNEYQHSGLRDDGYRILDRLLAMARGEAEIPS